MCHTALEKLCTLVGGLSVADGERHATIPGTHQPVKMVRIDHTPGHPDGDVTFIDLLCDAPSRAL